MASVFHDLDNSKSMDEVRYSSYIEYGKRFEKLLVEAMQDAGRQMILS